MFYEGSRNDDGYDKDENKDDTWTQKRMYTTKSGWFLMLTRYHIIRAEPTHFMSNICSIRTQGIEHCKFRGKGEQKKCSGKAKSIEIYCVQTSYENGKVCFSCPLLFFPLPCLLVLLAFFSCSYFHQNHFDKGKRRKKGKRKDVCTCVEWRKR